eukprot:1145912-Pelagomonas_calceolata.AAC.4
MAQEISRGHLPCIAGYAHSLISFSNLTMPTSIIPYSTMFTMVPCNQKMMEIGGPQITLLASDHPKGAHSSNLGQLQILCL